MPHEPWPITDRASGLGDRLRPALGRIPRLVAGRMTRHDFTDAPCRANPDLHFPNTRGSHYLRQVAAAKAVCAACPLRKPCLEVALTERDHHGRWYVGIWSGTSEADRDELRRRRGAA